MIQNDSMAISSVKYGNNLKLKQYNKLSLKGAISTNESYVYSQASYLSFFLRGVLRTCHGPTEKKSIKLSNDY